MKDVCDYQNEGICKGCDRDFTSCLEAGKCFYDSSYKSPYKYVPGDKVWVATKIITYNTKIDIQINQRVIDKRVDSPQNKGNSYWLLTLSGWDAGAYSEKDLYRTKQEALKQAYKETLKIIKEKENDVK